jgi:hypothetical protein
MDRILQDSLDLDPGLKCESFSFFPFSMDHKDRNVFFLEKFVFTQGSEFFLKPHKLNGLLKWRHTGITLGTWIGLPVIDAWVMARYVMADMATSPSCFTHWPDSEIKLQPIYECKVRIMSYNMSIQVFIDS